MWRYIFSRLQSFFNSLADPSSKVKKESGSVTSFAFQEKYADLLERFLEKGFLGVIVTF